MASVTIMATVTYGKCYLWQTYYGKCNYGKSIMANETEPAQQTKYVLPTYSYYVLIGLNYF